MQYKYIFRWLYFGHPLHSGNWFRRATVVEHINKPNATFTCIRIINRDILRNVCLVAVEQGGIGASNVSIRITSARNNRINFTIEVYGFEVHEPFMNQPTNSKSS